MKNETKEILEYMKKIANKNEEDFESELSHRDCALLLDYITSLEQQVQDLKADYGSKSQVERDLLKQENERLYKELEKADSITQSCIFEGSRSAGKSYRQCLNWLEDYKSRCEKALEYIKCGITGDLENDRAYVDENALLNILNGGDDNE